MIQGIIPVDSVEFSRFARIKLPRARLALHILPIYMLLSQMNITPNDTNLVKVS